VFFAIRLENQLDKGVGNRSSSYPVGICEANPNQISLWAGRQKILEWVRRVGGGKKEQCLSILGTRAYVFFFSFFFFSYSFALFSFVVSFGWLIFTAGCGPFFAVRPPTYS
jgi:hypothetical protein